MWLSNMNNYIIGSLSLCIIMLFIVVILFIKNRNLKKKNKIILGSLKKVEQMADFAKKDSTDSDIHKENFIKFISDSRDSAYEYIESVQNGLYTFINAVKPDIQYFYTYGEAGPTGPDHDMIKRIAAAYEELIKLMPDEEEK
jgi:hypothetical protein